jgi:peroxiredoxin
MQRLSIILLGQLFLASAAIAQSPASTPPDLTFYLPQQGQTSLSHYRGRVVALEFIITMCPHCQAASQVMVRIQKRFKNQDFQALEVAVNENAPSLVEKFAADYHVNFPVGWTSWDDLVAYMGFKQRTVVPQLALIDRQGNIHYRTPPEGDEYSLREDVIAARIDELLALEKSAQGSAHALRTNQ